MNTESEFFNHEKLLSDLLNEMSISYVCIQYGLVKNGHLLIYYIDERSEENFKRISLVSALAFIYNKK